MVSADTGTTASVLSNSVNSIMKSLPIVDIRNSAEILPLAGFFTGSLNKPRQNFNTDRKTFLHFNQETKEEDDKKRKKKVKN